MAARKTTLQRKPRLNIQNKDITTSTANTSMMQLIHNGEVVAGGYVHAIVGYDKDKKCLTLTPIPTKTLDVVNINTRHWGMGRVWTRLKDIYNISIPEKLTLFGEWNDVDECMEIDLSEFVGDDNITKVAKAGE